MKHTLFLFCISLFFLKSFSQDFATSDSKWVYDYNGAWAQGIALIEYEKDTLIGNRQCTQFNIKRDLGSGVSGTSDPIYFYTDNGRVEFSFLGIDFDLLFDFKAGVGDVWQVYRRFPSNNRLVDSVQVSIDAVFQSMINGKNLITQVVTYKDVARNLMYQDTIYENIGPMVDFLFPWDRRDRTIDGGVGGPLRCFYNNTLGLVEPDTSRFNSGFVYDCDQLVSINGIAIPDYQLEFYPNPVRDKLQIESYETTNLNLTIIDMLGRKMEQVKIVPGENEVDMSSFSQGIYHMSIEGRVLRRILKK